ncbi:MAG: hypothetical protein Q8P73_03965 [bacterium]|nr:hypothetical protein [bacterium]
MPKEAFERRFAFINDETLKKNIAIAFEYIVFLIDTAANEDHRKLIRSSLYKDATVYTGTVVEACLSQARVLSSLWKEESQGVIYKISSKKRIRYVIEHSDYKKIRPSSDFIVINRACFKTRILTKKEFELAEEIRTCRNKIHVTALAEIDNSYSKETLDAVFDKARKIIDKVEKKLGRL